MQKAVEITYLEIATSFIDLLLFSLIFNRLLFLLLWNDLFLNWLFLCNLGIFLFLLDLRFLLIDLIMTFSFYNYLSIISNHLVTLHLWITLYLVHTIATCSILSSLRCKYTRLILLLAHLSNLIFVFHMRLPVSIQLFFLQYSLFIKKPFGKSMILFLDSFRFSFSNSHVQASWSFYS